MHPAGHIRGGFVLLEMLLVVALIGIVAGATVVWQRNALSTTQMNASADIVVQAVRRAQLSALAMRQDDAWGVTVASTSATVFLGTSYVGRDQSEDEVYDLEGSISVSGLTEIIFAKRTGLPNTTGTVTLTSGPESLMITINGRGTVSH